MKIIKDPKPLQSTFIPNELLFRDELIKEIEDKIKLGAGNLLIFGDPGCGKTAATKKAISKFTNLIFIDINCVRDNTYAAITKKIIEAITGHSYNELGKHRGQLSEDVLNALQRKRKRSLVFLFDEIDKLVEKEGDHQQILNPILETGNSNVILISNRIEALNKLDQRLMSRLSPKRMYIPPYFASEILQILENRAKIALFEDSYDLEVLARIAKWCFETSGDIREALNLFFEACNIAEKSGFKLTLNTVPEAQESMKEIEFDKIFPQLTLHQRIIITGIAVLSRLEKEGYAEHKKLYQFYDSQLRKKESSPVGYRQFENYLKILELKQLTTITTRSPRNRSGRIVVSIPSFDVVRFIEKYFPNISE
jgi:cell division control protein 6